MKRLINAYTDGEFGVEQFRQITEEIDYQRLQLKEQLRQLEKIAYCWLEPTERFINALFEATLTPMSDDTHQKTKLLKKTGSN